MVQSGKQSCAKCERTVHERALSIHVVGNAMNRQEEQEMQERESEEENSKCI